MPSVSEAIALYRRGDVEEALAVCRARLDQDADDGEALELLGEIYMAGNDAARAAPCFERLCRLRPLDPAGHRRLAGALLSSGRSVEAERALRQAIELEPNNPRAHNNLGQSLWNQDRRSAAVAAYREALRLDPRYAVAHVNLGRALAAQGDLEGAIVHGERARTLDPGLLAAEVALGSALAAAHRGAEALACYDRVLDRAPDLAEAWIGRAAVLAQLDRPAEALDALERASLRLGAHDPELDVRKAWLLLSLDRASEALSAADDAASRNPQLASAHNARAGALRRLGQHEAALEALATAVALDPKSVEAWCNRGKLLHEAGDTAEAVAAYRHALALAPDALQTRTRLLARLIPAVPDSVQEARDARAAFDEELARLEAWLQARDLPLDDALTAAQQQFFYLSYAAESNRTVLERYRAAAAARLAGFERRPRVRRTPRRPGGGRYRLGIVSAHVHDHSVFNALVRGWLHGLDRTQFEVHLLSLGRQNDPMTREAQSAAEHFVSGSRSFGDWSATIRQLDFDALIYPELGMHEMTLGLAATRLAGTQWASWGHPETSGLPTIDGFLSSEALEPPDGDEHYSERLIRLPNLGVCVQPYEVSPTPVDWARLLPDHPPSHVKFICPGVPFKYRPEHDGVLVEIARRLPESTFVFFRHEVAALSRKLTARLAAAFRDAGLDPHQHLATLPWQPRSEFFGVLAAADVYLDTLGFSGFNTLLQAVQCHLPCVTLEGRFLRGRLGSGIVRHLGLCDLVAVDQADYVERALRLATDTAYRADVRSRLRAAEPRAYGDRRVIDALSDVLLTAPVP